MQWVSGSGKSMGKEDAEQSNALDLQLGALLESQ